MAQIIWRSLKVLVHYNGVTCSQKNIGCMNRVIVSDGVNF